MTGVTDVVSQLGGQADWRRGGLSKYGMSSMGPAPLGITKYHYLTITNNQAEDITL